MDPRAARCLPKSRVLSTAAQLYNKSAADHSNAVTVDGRVANQVRGSRRMLQYLAYRAFPSIGLTRTRLTDRLIYFNLFILTYLIYFRLIYFLVGFLLLRL